MNLLFLSRWYPFPAINGSKIRVFNLIRELSASHTVTLVSFADQPVSAEHVAEMRRYCADVHVIDYRRFQPNSWRSFVGFFSPQPRSFIDTHSDELEKRIADLTRRQRFDAVIASQFDMAPYALELRDTPKIFEELEISLFYDRYAQETRPLARFRKYLTWRKWAGYMRQVLAGFDAVTVVSEPEIAPALRVAPGYDRLTVVPNGADLQRLNGDFGPVEPDSVVYTGAMTYHVNFDAMKFFLNEVWPKIQARRPTARLYVCGTTEGVNLDALPQHASVTFTGHLGDIRPRLARSWVAVVPERYGGGTRIKVLEALALGTPQVLTTRAATGLQITDGIEALIADTPDGLASAVLRLLEDRELRDRISVQGRRTVEQHYDWAVIGRQLEAVIGRAVLHKNGTSKQPATLPHQ